MSSYAFVSRRVPVSRLLVLSDAFANRILTFSSMPTPMSSLMPLVSGQNSLHCCYLLYFDKHAPHCNPLPAHAHRACKSSNPCHFDCDSGYILVGHQCVCNGCSTPSPVPRALKARAASSDTAKVSAADALRVDNGVGPASKDVVNNLADGVPSGASSSDSSSPAVPCHLSEPSSPVFTPAPLSSQPSPSSSVQLSTLSSLPTPHDDLRALTRNILVQFGPRVQDLLKDFGVSCGCYDGLAGHDSNDVRVSLKSIVDLSTSFGGLLANMKSNLSLVDQLLLDTTQLIANIKHCLGLNLDYDLTDSLSELLAATQALLQALDSLKDGFMTCGCAEDLLVSLPHDLHVISDSDGASSQNSVIHPARAYPIRRELLYQAHRDTPTSTFSVETDTKHPANDKPGF
ncbi:hypothetical protein K435DRAFT_393273 [Dendrothele bispora CBS 962.96]|uniref:Uncharacterized protein n=1 Tax=Dendrothele bispora (strain CBS 962.96) TaxID=1314807 RepID=A0A4S8L8U9_DENBC|nr:hypothetical protein K435DRAFT_393273 [Dendrothele bispora CBS 962.96]